MQLPPTGHDLYTAAMNKKIAITAFTAWLGLWAVAQAEKTPVLEIFRMTAEATEHTSLVRVTKGEQVGAVHGDKRIVLTEKDLLDVMIPPGHENVIRLVMSADGQEKFRELTRQAVGDAVAIVINGELISTPRVQSEVLGETFDISGDGAAELLEKLMQAIFGE